MANYNPTKIHQRVNPINDEEIQAAIRNAPYQKFFARDRAFVDKTPLKNIYASWLCNSKHSKIIGLDKFKKIDFTFGVTQSLDDVMLKHNKDRLRVFPYEYHYTRRIFSNVVYIGDAAIEMGDWVIISLPFCFNGAYPISDLTDFLDMCYDKNVPVYIDAAFYTVSFDFILDLSHPAIKEVYFSLSKSHGLGFLRTGLRFSNTEFYGPIAMQNEYNYSNLGAIELGAHIINQFDINYVINKYRASYSIYCKNNGFKESNTLIIATSDKIDDQFLRHNGVTKIGVWW